MRNVTNSNCPSACFGSYGKIVKGLLLSMAIVLFNFTQVQAQVDTQEAQAPTEVQTPSNIIYINDGEAIDINSEEYKTMMKEIAMAPKSNVVPVTNPDLPANISCTDLRVVFVLDESGSILVRNAVDQVREAVLGLAESLQGSLATLKIIEFNSLARVIDLGETSVNENYIANLTDYLYNEYNGESYNPQLLNPEDDCPKNFTNWQDALLKIQPPGEFVPPSLVIFLTDGEPTAKNAANTCGYQTGGGLDEAITVANTLKTNGTHMFAIGVGDAIDVPNLQLISGESEFGTDGSIFTDDYSTGSFEDLKANLKAGLTSICGTELAITKSVDFEEICVDGQTVTFTITVENLGGESNIDAANVVVEDEFLSAFTSLAIVDPVPAGAAIDGQNLTYNIGTLAPGESKTIQIQAMFSGAEGNYLNIATADASNADMVEDDASVVKANEFNYEESITACDSFTIYPSDYVLNPTDSSEETLTSAESPYVRIITGETETGCPKTVTLNVTVNERISNETQIEASCGTFEWDVNGDGEFDPETEPSYSESGTHSVELTNEEGLCALATLELTITPAIIFDGIETSCDGPVVLTIDDGFGNEFPIATYSTSGHKYSEINLGDFCVVIDIYVNIGNEGDACTGLFGEGIINDDCECTPIDWDCPELEANIGAECNDGDDHTENDVLNEDCNCAGTPVFTCPDLGVNMGDACNDANPLTEDDMINENCECEGTPIIPTYDCPQLQANFGDECDDQNADTEGDVINGNCECVGTPIVTYDCDELEANIGDDCNDNNPNTFGDAVTVDCECVGTPSQVGDDCNNFSTYFISHGAGIAGSDIYKVNFAGSDAVLNFAFTVDYQAHMAIDAQGGIAYVINEDGSAMEAYDLSGYGSIGALGLSDGLSHVVAAVFNPNDGLVYVGDMVAKKVFTIDPNGAGDLVFYANAPVSGGDLAFQNGELYLATKTGNKLYKVVQNGSAVLVGNIPSGVNGLAAANNATDAIVSNLNGTQFSQISVADGSVQSTFDVVLNGEIYTVKNGDLASGCGDNDLVIEECFGFEIMEFNQGLLTNGNPVPADRSDATQALGEPDRSNAPGGFVSLGVGGSITIAFAGVIHDFPGNDIKIWETSFAGNNCTGSNTERADIELSIDNVTWVSAGTICLDGEVDMAEFGLGSVKYIRITNSASTSSSDGYDVDGVEALHGCNGQPSIVTGDCYATEVVFYEQGLKSNNSPIAVDRTDASKALGAPQRSDAMNFVALGYGGHIVLAFDGAVPNGPGSDIEVVETTYNFSSVGAYPEYADVYVAQEGGDWFYAGTVDHANRFIDISDAGAFAYVDYVKLVNNDILTSTDDGFDVDGVVAIHNCEDGVTPPVSPLVAQAQLISYPNPTSGSSTVVFTTGETTHTVVEVYDMSGRNVSNLFNAEAQGGVEYTLDFNGNNLTNGIYIYKLTTKNETIIEKFMIAK